MTPSEFLNVIVAQQYSRREIVKRALALGFSASAIGAILAACGGSDDDDNGDDAQPTIAPTETESADTVATAEPDDSTGEDDATPAEDEETATPQSTGSVDATGSIVVSLADEPLTLENWNAASAFGHQIIRNVTEALTNRDPVTNELVPELALSWERVDDLTWRFVLREGVTFHNGEAFNAEVAAYGLNYTWDADNGFFVLSMMGPQITAEAVDEYTLDVMTEAPDPILPTRLYFSPIPSMKQIEEDPESAVDHPIGTGPYMMVEWAQGQHVRLTVNPDWWGHNGNDAYGQATIKDAELQFRLESTVRAAQISTGEAHITHFLSIEDAKTVPVSTAAPSAQTMILRPDTMHPVMGDIRIRQAIAYAIDYPAVAESIYPGATPASQIFSPATFGYNDALEPYSYDIDRARELVVEAQADGVPIDQTVTVVTRGTGPGDSDFVQYVVEQLNQIGLSAETLIIEDAQYRPAVYGTGQDQVPQNRGWLVLILHGNELMDASTSIENYYSCGPDSSSTFCDDDLDPMIDEASALEDEEREKAYQELTVAYHEAAAIIPVVHLTVIYGMVEGLNWTPRLDGFMLLKEMSFE